MEATAGPHMDYGGSSANLGGTGGSLGASAGLGASADTYSDGQVGYDSVGEPGMGATGAYSSGAGTASFAQGPRAKTRLTEEQRLEREVIRRREQELERRQRIFDARRRTIGLDVAALDAQRAEKQARQLQEKAETRASDQDNLRINGLLTMMEADKRQQRRALEKHCKDHSLQHLNFESRREFDINDPHANRKATPMRLGDDDARLGPSSLQRFGGEDLTKQERLRQQAREMVDFGEQQKFEKAMTKAQQEEDEQSFASKVGEITAARTAAEVGETMQRRFGERSLMEENLRQAQENADKRKAMTQLEMERNEEELGHHATDPFLQESAHHYNPDGRVRKDAFKGSNRTQREHVAQQQLEQAALNEQRRQKEQFDDKMFARAQDQSRKQILGVERERARMRRAMAEQVKRENQAGCSDQKANLKRLDQLYTNEFRPEFFEQFGTSCR